MATSTSDSIMPLARGTAGLIGVFGMCIGAYCVSRPESYAVTFGFHPSSSAAKSASTNPFVTVMGGRTFATGLTLVSSVAIGGSDRSTGLLLLTAIVAGVSDAAAIVRFASVDNFKGRKNGTKDVAQLKLERHAAKKAARGHIITTAIISTLGWWMFVNGE